MAKKSASGNLGAKAKGARSAGMWTPIVDKASEIYGFDELNDLGDMVNKATKGYSKLPTTTKLKTLATAGRKYMTASKFKGTGLLRAGKASGRIGTALIAAASLYQVGSVAADLATGRWSKRGGPRITNINKIVKDRM